MAWAICAALYGAAVLTARARAPLPDTRVGQAFALARSELGKVPVLDAAEALTKEGQPEGNFVCAPTYVNQVGVPGDAVELESTFGVQAVWTLDGSCCGVTSTKYFCV
jgi:hypothetical protein